MVAKSLGQLFEDGLRRAYYAEQRVAPILLRLADTVDDDELSGAILRHCRETETQEQRLEYVFELIETKASPLRCPAIDALIFPMVEAVDGRSTPGDPSLIAAVQLVERFEVLRYGILVAWARLLGEVEAADLLDANLLMEEEASRDLATLAERLPSPAGL